MSEQKLELHTNKKGDIAEECETTQWKKNRGMSRHEVRVYLCGELQGTFRSLEGKKFVLSQP